MSAESGHSPQIAPCQESLERSKSFPHVVTVRASTPTHSLLRQHRELKLLGPYRPPFCLIVYRTTQSAHFFVALFRNSLTILKSMAPAISHFSPVLSSTKSA